MADVFYTTHASQLLTGKYILFVGDSNLRAQYKDLLWLLSNNSVIEYMSLRRKLEKSYMGDKLVTTKSVLTKDRSYREHRVFERENTKIEFMFVTRCLNDDVRTLLQAIKSGAQLAPDVLVMNSCLWDLTRWGPNGPKQYKENIVELLKLMKSSLPTRTMVMWTTPPPLASKLTGGLLVKQIEFLQETLRYEVLSASRFLFTVLGSSGYDMIDFHYYLQYQVHRRSCDGVHYLPLPVRFMTNLILTHISLSWGIRLPQQVNYTHLERRVQSANRMRCGNVEQVKQVKLLFPNSKIIQTVIQRHLYAPNNQYVAPPIFHRLPFVSRRLSKMEMRKQQRRIINPYHRF